MYSKINLEFTHRGRKLFKKIIKSYKKIQDLGAGELVINSIEKDGTEVGMIIDNYVKPYIKIP